MSNQIARLQAWYLAQCDGDWEHEYGVTIESLDNPGWRVTISLAGTYMEGVEFAPSEVRESERRWMICRVHGDRFEGAGGPLMLEEILGTFFEWAGIDPTAGGGDPARRRSARGGGKHSARGDARR